MSIFFTKQKYNTDDSTKIIIVTIDNGNERNP